MGAVWNELQPKLGCLFGANNGVKPPAWDVDLKLELNNLLCELKESLL